MTTVDPLLDGCSRCGHLWREHPGGYCPDNIDASGLVDPNAPMWQPRCTCTEDESSDGSATYEDDPECPIHGDRTL